MEQQILRQVIEICILYVFGILTIAARIWTRTKLVGIKGYDWDDWVVLGVAGSWTMAPFIGCFYVAVAKSRHTSDLTYEERASMAPEDYHIWEYGSQMYLFGLVGYFFIIWMLKFNMLCFYRRAVRGLWSERLVWPVMGLVLVSAMVIILVISLTCRPFYGLWQVWPDPGENCVPQNQVFFITILTFNLITDVCIMIIPLPVVIGIRGSPWRKAGIYLCFTMGTFCMFAAILRFVLIFKLRQTGDAAMWSMREDFVGIVVGQAPLLTPLFRRRFWVTTGYLPEKTRGTTGGYYYDSNGVRQAATQSFELNNSGSRQLNTVGGTSTSGGVGDKRKGPKDPYNITALGVGDSEEEMVVPQQREEDSSTSSLKQLPPVPPIPDDDDYDENDNGSGGKRPPLRERRRSSASSVKMPGRSCSRSNARKSQQGGGSGNSSSNNNNGSNSNSNSNNNNGGKPGSRDGIMVSRRVEVETSDVFAADQSGYFGNWGEQVPRSYQRG